MRVAEGAVEEEVVVAFPAAAGAVVAFPAAEAALEASAAPRR
jgi:hypothetical protein